MFAFSAPDLWNVVTAQPHKFSFISITSKVAKQKKYVYPASSSSNNIASNRKKYILQFKWFCTQKYSYRRINRALYYLNLQLIHALVFGFIYMLHFIRVDKYWLLQSRYVCWQWKKMIMNLVNSTTSYTFLFCLNLVLGIKIHSINVWTRTETNW